jgi:hypothetical protein
LFGVFDVLPNKQQAFVIINQAFSCLAFIPRGDNARLHLDNDYRETKIFTMPFLFLLNSAQ